MVSHILAVSCLGGIARLLKRASFAQLRSFNINNIDRIAQHLEDEGVRKLGTLFDKMHLALEQKSTLVLHEQPAVIPVENE
jgi:hypothetical protein